MKKINKRPNRRKNAIQRKLRLLTDNNRNNVDVNDNNDYNKKKRLFNDDLNDESSIALMSDHDNNFILNEYNYSTIDDDIDSKDAYGFDKISSKAISSRSDYDKNDYENNCEHGFQSINEDEIAIPTNNGDESDESDESDDENITYASKRCDYFLGTKSMQINDISSFNEHDEDDEDEESLYWDSTYSNTNTNDSEEQPNQNNNDHSEEQRTQNNNDDSAGLRDQNNRLDIGKPKEYESFNIIELSKKKINDMLKNLNDARRSMFSEKYTKEQVAHKLNHFTTNNTLTNKCTNELLGLLLDIAPNLPWPVRNIKNRNYKTLDFIPQDYRLLEFDVCSSRQHCCAFVGEYYDNTNCKICGTDRYKKCWVCNKKNCSNYKHFKYRTAFARVWYRPLYSLIYDLLHFKNFLMAINYKCADYDEKKYFRSDVRTGSNYKKHQQEMEKVFKNKYRNNEPITMINLLISEFYDGCQLFKTRVSNFWPLMITILNLPLFLRIQSGVGTFLLSLFTGTLNTPAERFLLEECLSEELVKFYEGIEYNINGNRFFVQVRLISTILDTKALEETLHVQGSNSYNGCFLCNSGKGSYYGVKTIYMGDFRSSLPIEHYLRYFGQSGYCCPPNFKYINLRKSSNKKQKNNQTKSTVTSININIDHDDETELAICKEFDGNLCKEAQKMRNDAKFHCSTNPNYVQEFMKGLKGPSDWIWYNDKVTSKFNYQQFSKCPMYAHCNYKDQIIYERTSTECYYNLYSNGSTVVKDIWHLHRLKYVDLATDICWDPFHTIFNFMKAILLNWKKDRINKYPIDYCIDNNMHYYLYARTKPNKNIPWLIDETSKDQIEACISEILIPSGLSNEFQFSNTEMFSQSGMLRSTSVIQIGTVLMKLILTIHPFPSKEYRYFYWMVYENLNQLMSPVFKTEKSIHNLQNKILELICLSQGLFPPSESRLIHHQLYCLSNYLITGGSITNFWSVSGERMMKALKICVPDGGAKFDYTTVKKYSSYENDRLNFVYSDNNYFNNNNSSFSKEGNVFQLENYKFELLANSNEVVIFNEKVNSFLLSLVVKIKKLFRSYEIAVQKSQLYKLFCDYRSIRNCKNQYTSIIVDKANSSFFQFINLICNNKNEPLNQFCLRLRHYFYDNGILKYNSAKIYGTEFSIREYNKNDMFKDDLVNTWNTRGSYSSWFKCLNYYELSMINSKNDSSFGYYSWCKFGSSNIKNLKENFLFGQFNYFIQIDNTFPDNNLHGSYIGCALTRYPKETNYDNYFVNFIEIRRYNDKDKIFFDNSFNENIYFINLEDVVPTRIMILGMDSNNKPIRNRTVTRSDSLDKSILYSKEKIPELIYFIELNENNKYVMEGIMV
jgi:hypothetical protein